jgi:glycosyltransferase involved in cell wall biosynthesis
LEIIVQISFYFPSPINYLKDRFEKPIGGAETALLHMSKALCLAGVEVEIIANDNSSFNFHDVLIVKRFPLVILKYRSAFRAVYFWSPDDSNHGSLAPLYNPENLEKFNQAVDGVFTISHYQYQKFAALGIKETKLIPSRYGINIKDFKERDLKPTKICIYTSSPKRGLELLPQIWPKIHSEVPDATLWVYSSMQTYRKDDSPYEELYNKIRKLPNTTYFGSIKWDQLVRTLSRTRLLLYPNIFEETSSLCTLEAVAAGCAVITSSIGALPESAKDNIFITPFSNPIKYINVFADWAIKILTDDNLFNVISQRNQKQALTFDWKQIATEWLQIIFGFNL